MKRITAGFAVLLVLLAGCGGGQARDMESTASETPFLETEPTESSVPEVPLETPEPEPEIEPEPEPDPEPEPEIEPEPEDFVRVKDYIPTILVELKYATTDNFTGQVVYQFDEAYLRYGTVIKLRQAQDELEQLGFGLKIWDAYRPVEAQFALWAICPDSTYVANPNTGYSSHSRGNTVDITLVCADGTEAVMPTGFDNFSTLADRDYSDCSPEAAENARLLEQVMKSCGFQPYSAEWWHFSDTVRYEVEQGALDTLEP